MSMRWLNDSVISRCSSGRMDYERGLGRDGQWTEVIAGLYKHGHMWKVIRKVTEVTGILSAADYRVLLGDQDREDGQRANPVLSVKVRKCEVRDSFYAGEGMELLSGHKQACMPLVLRGCWSPRKMLHLRECADSEDQGDKGRLGVCVWLCHLNV